MRLSDTRFFCWRAGTMQRRFERKSSLFVQLVDKLGCDELVIHADNVIVSVKLPMAYFRFCVMPYGVQSHQILWTDRSSSAKISTSTTATVFDRDNFQLVLRAIHWIALLLGFELVSRLVLPLDGLLKRLFFLYTSTIEWNGASHLQQPNSNSNLKYMLLTKICHRKIDFLCAAETRPRSRI